MPTPTEDREAIRHLMATYNINGDRGRVAEVGAVFAEDGVIDFFGEATTGRAEIVARLSRGGVRNPPLERPRHHLATSLIDLDGDTAQARTYFQVLTAKGLDHHGLYVDRFVREADGWRIAYRQVRIEYQSPGTIFPPHAGYGYASA